MTTALLLIDVQRNMLAPPNPAPDAGPVTAALTALLDRARDAGAMIVHVRNNGGEEDPDHAGSEGWQLLLDALPEELVIDKHDQDSFLGTGLADRLDPAALLVVAGLQSEYCVRTTALAALSRGHDVVLASGAHATYPDGRPAAELSAGVERELAAAGVAVVPHQDVRFD